MSSKVSRLNQAYIEAKNFPITKSYVLTVQYDFGDFSCLITPTEWNFIDEGILNPTLKNILNKKNIYLEYLHEPNTYLTMTNKERALSIAEKTFSNFEELNTYCNNNNIEIMEVMIIKNSIKN